MRKRGKAEAPSKCGVTRKRVWHVKAWSRGRLAGNHVGEDGGQCRRTARRLVVPSTVGCRLWGPHGCTAPVASVLTQSPARCCDDNGC